MPRNGSGVYSPTAGIPVVSGTTISSTAINNVLDDLGDEITASLPVSGVAPMTGALRVTLGSVSAPGLAFVGDTDTGIYSTGANTLSIGTAGANAITIASTGKAVGKAFDVDAITDVASAATCDIGAAATSEVNITGTTTITSFGTSNAGIVRRGTFAGALTLTHNATSLILPGGASITTAAGDSFVARSLGSGNWRVLSYERANGTAIAVGAVIDRAYTTYTSNADLSTAIPYDDTIPQVTEGTEVLSAALTPKTSTNRFRVRFQGLAARNAGATYISAALFVNGASNAVQATSITTAGADFPGILAFEYEYVPGSTSLQTLTVRVGGDAGTVRMNGTAAARRFGGAAAATLVVEEIAA